MRQLIYISSSTAEPGKADVDGILQQSRHNNALDGISGLLWTDGSRFLQVLEGSEEAVEAAFARIKADPRHTSITVQRDADVQVREFGDWSMLTRRATDPVQVFDTRMRQILASKSSAVRLALSGLLAG